VPSNTSMSMLSTAVTRVRAAVSSNEQYVNFYSGVARADRGPFVLSPVDGGLGTDNETCHCSLNAC